MFGGAYYIWIIGAFFLLAVVVIGGLTLALWLGHLIERKETGATHGFLELPEELRGKGTTEDTESTERARGNDEARMTNDEANSNDE